MIPKERLLIIFKNSGYVWAPYYPLHRILWCYELQKFLARQYTVTRMQTYDIIKTISIPLRFVGLSIVLTSEIPLLYEWKLYPEHPYNEHLAYLISKDGLYWNYSDRWSPDCELFETRDECFEYCVKKNSNSRYHSFFDLFPSKMLLLIQYHRFIINTIGHAYGIKTTTS